MHVSTTTRAITPSMTIGMDERARQLRRQGVDVISFAAGEPDFDTPEVIKEAAIKAIRDGFTKYTSPGGIIELREAVAERLAAEYGVRYDGGEIVVTAGGKPALYFTLVALCEPGDEVLLPVPAWVSYAEQIRIAGARTVPVPTEPEEDFQPAAERVAPLITSRTRALVVNSPHNPTGTVYSRETLAGLVELSRRHEFVLLCDDIYESMVYDGARHHCVTAVWPEARGRVVLLNSMSKTFAMTGWRIGYVAAPAEIASAVTDVQGHLAGNPNSIAQKAALAGLRQQVDLTQMVTEYDRRRRCIVSRLNAVPGIRCGTPRGAFYAFPDVRGRLGRAGAPATSAALCDYLLDKAHVAAVPGEAFNAPGFVRFSYATALSRIEEGLDRIGGALGAL